MSDVAPEVIAARAHQVFAQNDAMTLATTGGVYSPWVLGVYFASEDLALYCFLERSGKTMANVRVDPRVSFLVSKNDAQQDFVQGIGTLTVLPDADEARVRAMLVAKMSWFKTYTPVVPVRVDVRELFVSSFASGWFPAKRLAR